MKNTMRSLLIVSLISLISASVVSTSFAGLSEGTKMGSELSGDSVLLSGPFSIVFVPVMASAIAGSAVSDSLVLLGNIGDAISVKKVERQEKTTVVYGTATQKNNQQKVDVKFDVPNKVADKANLQPGKDVQLQKTPMGTLVTYDNKSLGFAAGTENNNMKSVPVR